MTMKEKSTLLTMQDWISLREDCGIAVRKLSLTRITHPTSQTYSGKFLAKIYQQHEKEKDKYNQRVIDIEKSLFNPLVFTTRGGMASECNRINKRLAEIHTM